MYKRFIIKSFMVSFLLWFSCQAIAAPQVASVSGTVAGGESIIVIGSGFGNKPAAAPLKFDFFEQGGADYSIGNPIANAWGMPTNASYYDPKYNASAPRPGSTKHIRCEWTSPSPGSGEPITDSHCPFYYQHNGPLNELYVTFWIKMNIKGFVPDTQYGPNVKWFRVVNLTEPSMYTSMEPTLVSSYVIVNDSSRGSYGAIANKSGLRGVEANIPDTTKYHALPSNDLWIRCEYIMKESSAPGGIFNGTTDGYVQAYYQLGGQGNVFTKVYETTGVITNNAGSNKHWGAVRFAEYNADELADMVIDWDDIYIDNTPARVEIGDKPVWGDCTHREIQVASAWTNESITFNVNQGSFTAGEQAYVFVVDSTGSVSQGYGPISMGESEGSATLLPPSNAHIVK